MLKAGADAHQKELVLQNRLINLVNQSTLSSSGGEELGLYQWPIDLEMLPPRSNTHIKSAICYLRVAHTGCGNICNMCPKSQSLKNALLK